MATDIDVNEHHHPRRRQDPTFNQLLGINNEGKIAGYFGSGSGQRPSQQGIHAERRRTVRATTINENFPGSVQTQVTGINNDDRTVGFWVDAPTATTSASSITMVCSPTLSIPLERVQRRWHDNRTASGRERPGQGGRFLDRQRTATITASPTTSSPGSFSEVNIAGFASTTTTAINNKGHIAGFVSGANGNDVSFIKEGNKLEWLTGPKGAVSVQALGINNEDQVVGSYTDGTGATHGFLFDEKSQTYTTIDDPNRLNVPGDGTVLNGINDKGQVVGFFMDKAGNTEGLQVSVSIHHS